MLAGCGKILENYVRNQFGVKVRSVELNVNQRCSGLTVSATDLNEPRWQAVSVSRQLWTAILGRWWHLSVRLIQLLLNLFMQLLPFQTLQT